MNMRMVNTVALISSISAASRQATRQAWFELSADISADNQAHRHRVIAFVGAVLESDAVPPCT